MAKRWTVAQAIVLAQEYRVSKHETVEEAATDAAWKDMCRRAANVAPLLYALAALPEANLLKYFNTSCSVRKLQSAIEDQKDFSLVDSDEDEDEEEVAKVPSDAPKAKVGRKPGPKKQEIPHAKDVRIDDFLELDLDQV